MGITKPAAEAAGKAMAGYPATFHHLAGEHAEVATLMKRVAASSNDSSIRAELFPQIRDNLLAHAHGEEAEFYPRLRDCPELGQLVAEGLAEHKRIEIHLAKLETLDMQTEARLREFEDLVAAVRSHVKKAEHELFAKAKGLVDSEQAPAMLERYERVEQQEKGRLAS